VITKAINLIVAGFVTLTVSMARSFTSYQAVTVFLLSLIVLILDDIYRHTAKRLPEQ
jgi:hypothetical protein